MSIVLENINLNLGGKPILSDFSLALPDTGVVCLTGPSGCGKTTLLHLLAGLRRPQSGNIRGLESKRLAVVFQEDRLLPWLNAAQNVALVLPYEDEALALPFLAAMELAGQERKLPAELSGGMRRRVSIARALAYDCHALLLDEPTNGLDDELARRVMAQILNYYGGRLIVVVTHDREFAREYADALFELDGPPLMINKATHPPERRMSEH